jgi:hypothetical protein
MITVNIAFTAKRFLARMGRFISKRIVPFEKVLIRVSHPIFPDKPDLFDVSGLYLKRDESRSQEPGARIKIELYQLAIPDSRF